MQHFGHENFQLSEDNRVYQERSFSDSNITQFITISFYNTILKKNLLLIQVAIAGEFTDETAIAGELTDETTLESALMKLQEGNTGPNVFPTNSILDEDDLKP